MSILLTQISDFVVKELNRRTGSVELNAPTDADQLWLYGKAPWIKMQSNAVYEDANEQAKNNQTKYILRSGWGKGTFLNSYDTSVSDSFRPKPGITDLNIAIRGHLGLMREAKVKFKVYTLGQLEIMQSLYMTPGIGILLEWGWSVPSALQSTLILAQTKENGENDRWLRDTLNNATTGVIAKGGGNYDALFGLVSDFEFTMQDDGTWDCETTIVGPGAMTVDINLNSPGTSLSQKIVDFIEDKISKVGTKDEVPLNAFIDVASFKMFESVSAPAESANALAQQSGSAIYSDPTKKDQQALLSKPNLYVTWAFVEDSINQFFDGQTNTFMDGVVFDSTTPLIADNTQTVLPVFRFSQGIPIGDNQQPGTVDWRSFSPENVLIPEEPANWDVLTWMDENQFKNSTELSKIKRRFAVDERTGDLRAVFLNYHTIVKENLLNSETIQEAINKMLSTLNEAAGGMWDLNLIYNDDYSSFRIVDFKSVYGFNQAIDIQNNAFKFNVNVKNSIVKGVTVSLRIPNALKVTAMIAANAPPGIALYDAAAADREKLGIFRGISRGVSDRFAKNRRQRQSEPQPSILAVPPSGGVQTYSFPSATASTLNTGASTQVVTAPTQQTKTTATTTTTTNNKPTPAQLLRSAQKKNFFDELSGDEKGALLNEIYNWMENSNSKEGFGTSGVLPGEVSVTINGIAGLRWGNAFQMTNLPARYGKNVVFQIKDITNEISGEGWNTTITGLMRSKYNPVVVKVQVTDQTTDTSVIPPPADAPSPKTALQATYEGTGISG